VLLHHPDYEGVPISVPLEECCRKLNSGSGRFQEIALTGVYPDRMDAIWIRGRR
jgi:hypothetical protein